VLNVTPPEVFGLFELVGFLETLFFGSMFLAKFGTCGCM